MPENWCGVSVDETCMVWLLDLGMWKFLRLSLFENSVHDITRKAIQVYSFGTV